MEKRGEGEGVFRPPKVILSYDDSRRARATEVN